MTSDDKLIKSGDVIGKSILDSTGGKLGAIREVYLDRDTGQAQFAKISLSVNHRSTRAAAP